MITDWIFIAVYSVVYQTQSFVRVYVFRLRALLFCSDVCLFSSQAQPCDRAGLGNGSGSSKFRYVEFILNRMTQFWQKKRKDTGKKEKHRQKTELKK